MIKIHIGSLNAGFIWNAADWFELRRTYHIVGNLTGIRCSAAKNSKILALPCQLLPEEITLLVEENICKLVQTSYDYDDVFNGKEKFDTYKKQIQHEQMDTFRKTKEKSIYNMIDTIIKNKEIKTKETIDKNEIFQDELNKIQPLAKEHVLVQRFLGDPWLQTDDYSMKLWTFPNCKREKLKYAIFKDLWHKKFFITNGNKFGGDYLVYYGDPCKFHAQYIIICKYHDETFKAAELAMYGRVGSNAKKTVVIASLNLTGQVVYQSLSWADIVM